MNEYFAQAKAKLDKEEQHGRFTSHAKAMRSSVKAALLDFCRQNEEFAQAVVQGGSFSDCMAEVVKHIKNGSISDLEAYAAAVQFYFPGAGINMQMTIDLCAEVKKDRAGTPTDKGLILDLSAFF